MISKLDIKIINKVKYNKQLSANDSLQLSLYAKFYFGEAHTKSQLKQLGISYILNDKATVMKANSFKAKQKNQAF